MPAITLSELKGQISEIPSDQKIWYLKEKSHPYVDQFLFGLNSFVDTDNSMTKEKFMKKLGKELGDTVLIITKPVLLDMKDINMLYDFIIDSLNHELNPDDKLVYTKNLIYCLSDSSYSLPFPLKFFLNSLFEHMDKEIKTNRRLFKIRKLLDVI